MRPPAGEGPRGTAHLLGIEKTIARLGMGTGGAGAEAAGGPPFHSAHNERAGPREHGPVRAPRWRRASHVVGTGLCVPLLVAAGAEKKKKGGWGVVVVVRGQKQTRPVRQ